MMYDVAVWLPSTCATFGRIKHQIQTPPKHGRLDFTTNMSKAKNIPANCKGKVRGLQIIYTPDRGYRGPDSFYVSVIVPRFENDPAPTGHPLRSRFTVK
ncbi:hypothetical protein [Hoeflea olei]|uniref:hypothetical protein n=1 Tax=Hoeflea olei TaxID=1480615 RepID=UPI001112374A|nr:hypothetical protein [Hoeflea olei]